MHTFSEAPAAQSFVPSKPKVHHTFAHADPAPLYSPHETPPAVHGRLSGVHTRRVSSTQIEKVIFRSTPYDVPRRSSPVSRLAAYILLHLRPHLCPRFRVGPCQHSRSLASQTSYLYSYRFSVVNVPWRVACKISSSRAVLVWPSLLPHPNIARISCAHGPRPRLSCCDERPPCACDAVSTTPSPNHRRPAPGARATLMHATCCSPQQLEKTNAAEATIEHVLGIPPPVAPWRVPQKRTKTLARRRIVSPRRALRSSPSSALRARLWCAGLRAATCKDTKSTRRHNTQLLPAVPGRPPHAPPGVRHRDPADRQLDRL